MNKKLSLLGAFLVLAVTALLDTPTNSKADSMYYNFDNENSMEADAQNVQRTASYSYEFLLDDMQEVDDYIVETYKEYQVHEDTEGNIISRIPTTNYQYLKYEKE
ncbi:hypothetical protein [Paucisalibacillus globulus]|uniref:hypothetical protein n=1 Tax=Paucisalibacillus globulus TaxID=351095 RepID=UPI0004054848|nr:hypothetical protein [Paucisalibacillus globulus]